MYTYQFYGYRIAIDVALGLPETSAVERPALVCRSTDIPLTSGMVGENREAPRGCSDSRSRQPICAQFEDAIEFCIDGDSVFLHRLDPDVPDAVVRVYFLGPVLSAWLEQKGILALHGSCVELDGKAVAFISASGGGKSNIALSALVAGEALMSDDIVAVDHTAAPVVRPSFPQMRLWPDDVPPEWGPAEALPLVHPRLTKRRLVIGEGGRGRYEPDARPLACIYVPVRTTARRTCSFDALGPADALMELVRCSFSPDFVEITGLQPQRLAHLAHVVSAVPVRRIVYPEGREHLPGVWEAIVSDYRAIAG